MKILSIENNYNNPYQISECFKEFGHEVIKVCEARTTVSDILKIVKNEKIDLVFTEEARMKRDYFNTKDDKVDEIVGNFKKVYDLKIPIIAWMTNIFMSIKRREPMLKTNPIFKADIVFSTDGGHQKEFEELGINHICLRQGIYLPEAGIAKADYPTRAEIGFIGSVYPWMWKYRQQLVEWLKKTYGDRFEHFGQNGQIRHEKLSRLVSTLKIVIGDSVYSPHYWSNRIYEMLGRGAFLIHPMIDGLDKEFTPYKHFIPYNYGDFDGLKQKIDYYLEHEKERDVIRKAGMEYCIKYHTYQIRVKKLLEILVDKKIITKQQAFPLCQK